MCRLGSCGMFTGAAPLERPGENVDHAKFEGRKEDWHGLVGDFR